MELDIFEKAFNSLNEITKNIKPDTDYKTCINCSYGLISPNHRFSYGRHGNVSVWCKRLANKKFIVSLEPKHIVQKNIRFSFKNKNLISLNYFTKRCDFHKDGKAEDVEYYIHVL
jgi:hypothetical protein